MLTNVGSWKLIVAGVLAALLFGVAQPQAAEEKGRLEAFHMKMDQRGFIVQKGSVDFPEILGMCCRCELPSCYGNNASSTYGLFALPPAPTQTTVNPYAEWFTADGNLPADWSYWWRMRPDEAVVFIGPTPPKVSYFGFTAYVYDRFVPGLDPGSECQCQTGKNCPQRPQPDSALHRYPIYASLGDTLNQMTINVPGGRNDPYEKNVVILMAADRNIARAVRHELIAAGYPANSINLLPVSPAIARLGLDSQDDTVSLLMRVAPIPGTDVTPYHDVPKSIFRITPNKPVPADALAPIAPPDLSLRGTGETELALLPAVDALGQAVIAKYSDYSVTPIKMASLPEGYNCLENTQNCLADNRDTIYVSPAYNIIELKPLQNLALKEGEFYVAYGVIHPKVNKATYSNISVMGWGRKAAPVMVNHQEMVGSARYYLDSGVDPETIDKIYAFKIARSNGCGDNEPCKEVGYECGIGIPSDEDVALVFRAYVEPSTAVGPALGEVILDRILKFTPKTR